MFTPLESAPARTAPLDTARPLESAPAGTAPLDTARPRFAARLDRDESGTMSIVSVFAFMLLAMLLGMVMNVAYQVDGKVKMQNAADAASYSGGIVLARGMNTLAFTNHLLCDIFATTAILREGRDRNAQSLTPSILAAWSNVAPQFNGAPFPKLKALAPAIAQKVPLEQQMVNAYSDWIGALSDTMLPTWEMILSQELIPKFQRALTVATPRLAQQAANEITRQHGLLHANNTTSNSPRGVMTAALWRTSGQPVGGDGETARRTLPVVDPELDPPTPQFNYLSAAQHQRNHIAHTYLRQWNNQMMSAFDSLAKMSQFGRLWRGFTCGQLNKLLNQDYPTSNLPFQLRAATGPMDNNYIEQDYHFVGVAYWPQVTEMLPGLFKNSNPSSAETFAEIVLFIPRNRLIWNYPSNSTSNPGLSIGGVPGGISTLPGTGGPPTQNPGGGNGGPTIGRQGKDTNWSLMNQSWNVKLTPAMSMNIPVILSTPPPMYAQGANQPQVPSLGQPSDVNWNLIINH